jgi:hypothetical protein
MSQTKYKHLLHLDIEEAFRQGKDLLDYFPELAVYPEFQLFKGKELNKFIAYVFYAYDPGSGFVNKIKDLVKRKEEAMLAAGFTTKQLKDLRVAGSMAMLDKEVNAMITRFLRSFVRNLKFELWVSGREMLAQLLEEVRTPIDKAELKDDAAQRANKTRMEYFSELPALIKQVEEFEDTLFGNDVQLKESVIEQAAQTNMGMVEKMLMEESE